MLVQMKAKDKGLLNRFGRPNTSAFATYAYSAGLHLDSDESVTHGWVIQRGKEVHCFFILKKRHTEFYH
jgi:hypothetical protein